MSADINVLLDQRRRALQSLTRFDGEFGLLREAGRSAPEALCVAVTEARWELRRLEIAIAKARELEAQGLVEPARIEQRGNGKRRAK